MTIEVFHLPADARNNLLKAIGKETTSLEEWKISF